MSQFRLASRATKLCANVPTSHVRGAAVVTPPWRPASALDEWVQKEARPISLRQITFFSRSLTEGRLLSSANYLRIELPTRIAHRLRDMQTLPFAMVTNPHISSVYELYYKAFDTFRRVPEITTIDENDAYCKIVGGLLQEHLTVIPRLAIGILECQDLMGREAMDKFTNNLLRSRISRRVLAEHHLALTETFNSPPQPAHETNAEADIVGKVLLKCNAKKVLEHCGSTARQIARQEYGAAVPLPEIKLDGHLDATFPYILSHLEYIIGEILRNSFQAVLERFSTHQDHMPAIEVLVCETPQHVIFRISDQGGGISREIMPHLWSFSKGPRRQRNLENLMQVPKMAATMEELELDEVQARASVRSSEPSRRASSLGSLTSRPPQLKLGVGLPMSRVYAEYWAGSLELHSLEGYGVDVFLQIPKLGNRNEQLTTRAVMDKV